MDLYLGLDGVVTIATRLGIHTEFPKW